ncbi:MAG: sulfotransferase domain-containing protein, partial [Bacteroidota bacterium]
GWSSFHSFTEQISCLNVPEIKVILFLRNHTDWLWSAYLHELKMSRKKGISFKEYAYSFGEKGLSWSDRINCLSKFNLMVVNYQDFLNNPALIAQQISHFSGVDSSSLSTLDKSTRQNLTPKTEATMAVCQNFERGYQFVSNSVRYLTGYRLPIESLRESFRDSIISLVANSTPNSARIERPNLPKDLQDRFDDDWEAAWSSYR